MLQCSQGMVVAKYEMMMMMEVIGCMVRKKRGGGIVKSCPASFAGQLHCSNTFAGQVSPNPAARMTSTRAVHCL